MAHIVNIFDAAAGFDEDGWMRPVDRIEVETGDEAIALLEAELARQNSMSAASIKVDWRLCPDLSEYFRLTNAVADWLERNPIDFSWMGKIVEDPEYWAEYGVTTPEEMEKFSLLQGYSDYHKEVHGFRPRGTGMTMETPIEDLEAAYDALSNRGRTLDNGPDF